MDDNKFLSEINKRIEIARENQHKMGAPHEEFQYWCGAADALQALIDKLYSGE